MADWKAKADKAKADGYLPQNPLEMQFLEYVQEERPALAKELANDLPNYLIAKTSDALDQYVSLTEAGTPAETAMELVKADLMPPLNDPSEPASPDE